MRRFVTLPLALLLGVTLAGRTLAAQQSTPLVVFNAGSLARPFRELLASFAAEHPGVTSAQENSGSLEAARKITELGKTPDLIAVADYGVIAKLLVPKYATWYTGFGGNAMVLAYTDKSAGAGEISAANWWDIMTRPKVRTGYSDPALDPAGYRTVMVFQLAERFYRKPGLADRLLKAVPRNFIRPKSADLVALVEAGELDYAFEYRSVAMTSGLKFVELPKQIDLSDPALAETYAAARVRLPGASRTGADSVEFRGEPIVFALTVPAAAPHPELALAFARYVLSPKGQAVLRANGLTVPPRPDFVGDVPAAVRAP